jgi:hypothetical protein
MIVESDWLSGLFRRNTPGQTHSADPGANATTGGELEQEPVVVWEAANLMEAEVVKGRLQSEGIPAVVRSEALGAIYGLTTGSLAAADVLVPSVLAEKAFEILYSDSDEDTIEPDES